MSTSTSSDMSCTGFCVFLHLEMLLDIFSSPFTPRTVLWKFCCKCFVRCLSAFSLSLSLSLSLPSCLGFSSDFLPVFHPHGVSFGFSFFASLTLFLPANRFRHPTAKECEM